MTALTLDDPVLRRPDSSVIWGEDLIVRNSAGSVDLQRTRERLADNDTDAARYFPARFGARLRISGQHVYGWDGTKLSQGLDGHAFLGKAVEQLALNLRWALTVVDGEVEALASAEAARYADPTRSDEEADKVRKAHAAVFKSVRSYATKLLSNAGQRSLQAQLVASQRAADDELDADARLLPCSDGSSVDLIALQEAARAHHAASGAAPDAPTSMATSGWQAACVMDSSPHHLQTVAASFPVPTGHVESAWRGSEWERYLADVFDTQTAEWFRRVCGATLFGTPEKEKRLYNLSGPADCGKSFLLGVLEAALSGYARSLSIGLLVQGAKSDDFELDGLRGRRLVTCVEPSQGDRWNESVIKKITGGDKIQTRQMYRSSGDSGGEWRFRATLFVASNNVMRFSTSDDAMVRRIVPVPMTVRFVGADKHSDAQIAQEAADAAAATPPRLPRFRRRDESIEDRLKSPAGISAVGAWLVQGAWEWAQIGAAALPMSVRRAQADVIDELDSAVQWCREMIAESQLQVVVATTAGAEGAPADAVRPDDDAAWLVDADVVPLGERLALKAGHASYSAWVKSSGGTPKTLKNFGASVEAVYGAHRKMGRECRSRFIGLRATAAFVLPAADDPAAHSQPWPNLISLATSA